MTQISNRDVERLLKNISTLLEIKGETRFRVNAYRNAAESIAQAGGDLKDLVEKGDLNDLPGIGKAIGDKITEYVNTGKLDYYDKLCEEVPEDLLTLSDLPGMGPKRVKAVWEKLGITDIRGLKKAAQDQRVQELEGFGPKIEEKILEALDQKKKSVSDQRYSLGDAWFQAQRIIAKLKKDPSVIKISAGGSVRRMKASVGDVDILVASDRPEDVMDLFTSMKETEKVLLKGSTKTSVKVENGMQVDLRVVEPACWGTALQYFTGSQEHNVKMRELSLKKGFSLSEYALSPVKEGQDMFFEKESDLYRYLGLQWIPPELRESWGEVEMAKQNRIPQLVSLSDIKGDLQSHSDWSDGRNTLYEMARTAYANGLEYLLVTDHSSGLGIAHGISGSKLMEQVEEIERINSEFNDSFRLLKGIEVEVKSDGTLDLNENVLKELDIVVAGIHSSLRQERKRITDRYLATVQNPLVHILAHPTGRLIGSREETDVDWDQVFRAAAENRTLLEINSNPMRLDLPGRLIRRAREFGCLFVINTDAHSTEDLNHLIFGVGTAGRGLLTKEDVLNTSSVGNVLSYIKDKP